MNDPMGLRSAVKKHTIIFVPLLHNKITSNQLSENDHRGISKYGTVCVFYP